jgi:hypothetical protein
MKKYFQNKNVGIIVISFIVFVFLYLINRLLGLFLPLYLSGFFLALFIPGLAIKNILDSKNHWLDNLLAAPVFTIFFFIPVYYAITIVSHGKIGFAIAFVLIMTISILSIILTHGKEVFQRETNPDKKFLFFGVGAFFLVHLATTLAYKFIPEIDGYTDLVKIENILSSGIFNISYRPLFSFLVAYISTVSQIPPYWLFKFGMIFIQVSGVYYLYQLIKATNTNSSATKYLTLLAFVSVPVINLEIDYVRPNVIFIFALLPFIHYLSQGMNGLKINFIFSSIIAATGLLFHEFFGILLLLNFFFILNYFYKKFNQLQKNTFWLSSIVITFILLLNIHKFGILMVILQTLNNFIKLIIEGIHWKWWFLNTYSNMDGNNLGWNGLTGILKYYAYFLSPALLIVFIIYTTSFLKKSYDKEIIHPAEKIISTILFIGLIFAEFLPRIDYKTLPDRFWPMISMPLVALMPFAFSKFRLGSKKIATISILAILLVGIGGSIYIAKTKGGYISAREYNAATWISKNVPGNSIFITQGGNGPMLSYFAKQEGLSPHASFFLNKNTPKNQIEILPSQAAYKNALGLFNASLNDPSDERLAVLNSTLRDYHTEIEKERMMEDVGNSTFTFPENKNIYILYSLDKFNNYYVQRQWWRDVNFYGADLTKFKEGYDLIYNDNNIVYIWKKK